MNVSTLLEKSPPTWKHEREVFPPQPFMVADHALKVAIVNLEIAAVALRGTDEEAAAAAAYEMAVRLSWATSSLTSPYIAGCT